MLFVPSVLPEKSGGVIRLPFASAGGVGGFARRWPNVVASSPETIARVDGRWAEYGLGEFVESPSLRYLKLQERPGAEF